MMEFNYLLERGAVIHDRRGRYVINYQMIPGAMADLAKELLEIEATGDRQRAENWFKKYNQMPEELKSALKATENIPVDIDPVYAFPERVK